MPVRLEEATARVVGPRGRLNRTDQAVCDTIGAVPFTEASARELRQYLGTNAEVIIPELQHQVSDFPRASAALNERHDDFWDDRVRELRSLQKAIGPAQGWPFPPADRNE